MSELGIGVDMDYSPTGSGAYVLSSEVYGGTPCSQTVYVNNFYYNPNTIQGVHLASYTTDAWITLMENEINSGRVVQYEGDDATAGGHTWVMDGYEPQASGDLLHMNWGWGGAYNGWFAVTNLATPGFDPVQNDAALIGIEPLLPYSLTLTPASPSICPSGNTTLTVSGPATATYTWTPATGLSCTTCTTPTASPSSTTLYTVKVDSAGVIGTISVAVTVTGKSTANFSFNAAASCTLPENVAFINSSANSTGYIWDFGDGTISTVAAPQHSYTTSGTYTVKLYSSNACGVDSMIQNQALQVSGGAPVGAGASICSGQTAILTATGANLSWYADPSASTLLNTGNQYITSNLTATSTYYVNSSVSPSLVAAGPATDAIGGTGVFNTNVMRGLTFDCTVAQTLMSVVVYAQGAGGRTFVLEDAQGNILDSATFTLYDGPQTVYVGFNIPVGTNMVLGILTTANMMRNTDGAVFPYISTDGTVSITGNNAAAAGRYYFFYDWQLQQASCTTAITPVTVYVLNAGGGSFTASGKGSPTVTFAALDQAATTYTWSFGDGSTSTQMDPAHTYASSGTYTVELVVSNGTCSDTISRAINTAVLAGIDELTTFSSLSVYPNPATNAVSLNVNSSKAYSDCQLSINNMLGQNVYAKSIDLASGSNTVNMDITNLTAGVYFISLQNGKDVVTTKFVKE
jgi:PKD repeat protein